MNPTLQLLSSALQPRLSEAAAAFFESATEEIRAGVPDAKFSVLLSKASRFAPREDWNPSSEELQKADEILSGWSPVRWTMRDVLRVALILSRTDLAEESGYRAIEEAFRYSDEGESCALFRAIPLCSEPERFLWRVSDGCRTNMTSVFEAIACDTPYPARYFDDVAWRQLVIKAVFMGVSLPAVQGLDERLDSELARMALDLADERRSAGRDVQPDLWLTLGSHGGERGLESIEQELQNGNTAGRSAAAFALARAGKMARLQELAASESDPHVAAAMQRALAGEHDQRAFEHTNLNLQGTNG